MQTMNVHNNHSKSDSIKCKQCRSTTFIEIWCKSKQTLYPMHINENEFFYNIHTKEVEDLTGMGI